MIERNHTAPDWSILRREREAIRGRRSVVACIRALILLVAFLHVIAFAAPGDPVPPTPWTFDSGNPWSGDGQTSTDESDTDPQSLRLASGETAVSSAVDLSNLSGAELSLWWSRGSDEDTECFWFGCLDYDPGAGDNLVVEYSSDGGASWSSVDTVDGDGPADEKGTITFSIPQSALTSEFQVRATNTGTSSLFDPVEYWFIDTVTVTDRSTIASPDLVAEYRMEDGSWSGSTGEVTDSSDNNLDGTAFNGASIADADPLASGGDPGTCSYGTFDSDVDQYLEVPDNSRLDLEDELTITAWIYPQSIPDSGLMTILSKDENYEFHVTPGGEINWWWGGGLRTLTTNGANISAETWYHVAITYESGQQRIYVNASGFASAGETGTLTTNSDPLQIGADQNFAGRYFDGRIDEVRIYNRALGQSDIQTIYNSGHPCGPGDGTYAWYQLDEMSYDGSAGEVLDASGNGRHGTTRNDVTSYPNDDQDRQVCSGAVIADDDTGAGNAIDTGVDIDDDLGSSGSVNFWFWSQERWRQLSGNRMLLDASNPSAPGGSKYFYVALTDATNAGGPSNRGARLTFGLEDDDDDDFVFDTVRLDVEDQTWVHIGITWNLDDEEMEVFVNGSLIDSWDMGGASDTLGDLDTLYVGDNRSGYQVNPMSNNSAYGRFDEVRLYDRVIDQNQMASDRDATHPCGGGGIDHFVLDYASNGINCRAEGVTLRAEDASGDLVTDYDGSVNLSTSENIGDWTEVVDGNGSLNAGADNSGEATYTFDASDGGDAVLALRVTEADTLTVNAAAANDPATDDGTQGAITFRPWGFEIDGDLDASGRNPVPTQVAGREFEIEIAAVGELPEDPGCNVIEEYAGDRNLAFWFDHENPTTGDLQVLIENTQIASSEGDASEQTVNFTGGVARVSVDYRDVGEIQLHARDDDGIGAPPDAGGDEIVGGGTGPFVVRPYAFEVDVPNDPDPDPSILGPNQSAFTTAGEAFDVTVRALVWGDDDNDGTPDTGDELHDNDATPNFGREGESVQLTPALVAPTPGSNGGLSNATFDAFTDGTQTKSTLRWNEVGYVDLQANLVGNDYLGTGEDVTGVAETIGRFYPDRFRLSGTSLTDRATPGLACTGTSPFTYIGERFDTDFTLTAVATDAVGSNTTTNYEGAYAHLDSRGELNLGAIDQDDAERTGSVQIDNASIGWADGQSDVALQLKYVRDDPEGPYAPLRVGVAPVDPVDNVTLDPDDVNLDVDGNNAHGQTGTVQLRFGRLIVENAGGSELANIDLPLRVEYWTGSTWAINTLDDCTTFTLADHVDLANDDGDTVAGNETIPIGDGTTEILGGDLMIMGGRAEATFDAPQAGNTGWVELTVVLDGTTPSYDYLGTGPDADDDYDANPVGRATFGIYSGDDEWIHLRRTR